MKYTIQCLFPTWSSNTVTVEADTVDEACEKAITEANDDGDSWKSLDDCGDTFVQRIVEGDHDGDAYPYKPGTDWKTPGYNIVDSLPIPAKHSEHPERELAGKLLAALKDLQRWHDHTGGWEGAAWQGVPALIAEAEGYQLPKAFPELRATSLTEEAREEAGAHEAHRAGAIHTGG